MEFITGRLIARYKRFLADIKLDNGDVITAHCPNTGSMKRCAEPGWQVWLSDSNNPKRKYRYSWEYVLVDDQHLACINTQRPNKMVAALLASNEKPAEFADYDVIKSEVKYGDENSRIDFLLQDSTRQTPDCYLEVKNCTLLEDQEEHGIGYFPDAKTERGQKHLRELIAMKQQGCRAVLFFCVSHTGIKQVKVAAHIDPIYAELLTQALQAGVEVLAWQMSGLVGDFRLLKPVPFIAEI